MPEAGAMFDDPSNTQFNVEKGSLMDGILSILHSAGLISTCWSGSEMHPSATAGLWKCIVVASTTAAKSSM